MITNKTLQAVLAAILFLVAIASAGDACAQVWIQLAPTGGPPVARHSHSAVFNANNNRMIVFGGNDGPTAFNDVWVLAHADGKGGAPVWTQLVPTGAPPAARVRHLAVFDEANNRMIVFAGAVVGNHACSSSSDVWVLSHADGTGGTPNWTQLFPLGSLPSARYSSSAVYDPSSNRMIAYGGSGCNGVHLHDVWVLSNANGLGGTPEWTQLAPTGLAPEPRFGHTAVYNPETNRMVISGGEGLIDGEIQCRTCREVANADSWVLADANGLGGTPAWTELHPPGGSGAAFGGTAVYDLVTNSIVNFGGGCGACGASNSNFTTVVYNADGTGGAIDATFLRPLRLPPPRIFHTAIYNAASNRMVIFGGSSAVGNLNDTWVLIGANGISDIPVSIDIRPGTTDNTISLSHDHDVPVAILSTATFDAPSMVDQALLTFGSSGTEDSLEFCDAQARDVNQDGRPDLICHFVVQAMHFPPGAAPAYLPGFLKGTTVEGATIGGSDLVHILQ